MLVLYIFVGIIVLILYYIYFLNNIQENLTTECQNILDSQKRMSNRAAFETETTQYCVYDNMCRPVKSNYCGTNNLDLLPAPVYKTKEECQKAINPYAHLSPSECLSMSGRGTCSGSDGIPICYPGSPEGVSHQYVNGRNLCYPSRQGCLNSWKYGFDESIWNLS